MPRVTTGRRVALLLRVIVASLACTTLAIFSVHAQSAREQRVTYETKRLQLFMSGAGLVRDPAPEGKRIAYVRFERREVFEPDEFQFLGSTWPNVFHWLTVESRIRVELLLREGDAYSDRLAEESMRNLRGLPTISLARVVAVRTGDPNSVGLVVYTRDLWSLRLEQSFAGAGRTFTASGQLVERNFLGRSEALAVRGSIDPLRFSLGQTFSDPRLLGQPLSLVESFDVIWNRARLQAEGSSGAVKVGRPLYNLAQRTGFGLYGFYADYITRVTSNGAVVGYDLATQERCLPGGGNCLARVWHDQRWQFELSGDYRIGERYKSHFTLGLEAQNRRVTPNAETAAGAALSDEQITAFRNAVLPRVRRDIYPFLRYRLTLPNFVGFTNLVSFGQSENVQVGPSVDGFIGVPLRAYGAASDGLVLHAEFSYAWAQHDALWEVSAEGVSRLENGRAVDQRGILRARAATPVVSALIGRFVVRAYWDVRNNDSQRTFVSLGGENGLRGFAAQAFYGYGANRMLANFEYRSLPWLLESVHIGAVVFYDVGRVYPLRLNGGVHHAVGAGLRVLFPQFNRGVFRVDVGVPIGSPGISALLTYGSEQYLPLTAAEDLALTADQSSAVRQNL